MVPKIITHAALVVTQNKQNGVRVLGRKASLKSKRHSPPTSLLGSSTNVPATRFERRSRTVQSNGSQGCVALLRKNHDRLLLANWNEAKKCHLDIARIFFYFLSPVWLT